MSLDVQDPKKLGKEPLLKTGKFTDFTIKREGWNKYRISDGTILRARVMLTNCLLGKSLEEAVKQLKPKQKLKLELILSPKIIFAVEVPPDLRGNPDAKLYTSAELNEFVTKKDMDFETAKEMWNLYTLENGLIVKFRLSVATVNKTSKFETGGMPVYTINSTIDVKLELPAHIRKMLEKKGREFVKIAPLK